MKTKNSHRMSMGKQMGIMFWQCAPRVLKVFMPCHMKPKRLEAVLHNKRSHHNEKPAHCKE